VDEWQLLFYFLLYIISMLHILITANVTHKIHSSIKHFYVQPEDGQSWLKHVVVK
jgi:hypothetical protein